jgi:fumarylacetoacetase
MTGVDETHDPSRRSFVSSANGHSDFPIQNLPFGVFSDAAAQPRGGVAIGDRIVDLRAAAARGLFSGEAARAAQAASGPPRSIHCLRLARPRATRCGGDWLSC